MCKGKTQKLGGSGGMPPRESWTLGLSEIRVGASGGHSSEHWHRKESL